MLAETLLSASLVIGASVNFVKLVADKTGVRSAVSDMLSELGLSKASQAVDCDLCLSWWLCVAVSAVMMIVTNTAAPAACAPCGAMVSVLIDRTRP